MDADRRYEQLAQIAEMYYISRLTQEQIAARTGYSRSMISRFLTEAYKAGVVEISINYPLQRNIELEHRLISLLDLQQARVLKHNRISYAEALQKVGELAAKLFAEMLRDDLVIGISWGTALYETVKALMAHPYQGIQIVQMLGSLGTSNPEIDGPELMWRLADKLSAQYSAFPVPLLVDTEATRDSLITAPHAHKVVERFNSIDLALVGIGTVNPALASLLRTSYINRDQLEELHYRGAVGDVCVLHYDIQGKLIDTPLTRSFLGISASALLRVPVKIGVAAGAIKAPAILGACRAGLVNVLVIDDIAATEIISLIEIEEQSDVR
jgi:DNA-binding transcriptional regulator LsrR (DeoR family)